MWSFRRHIYKIAPFLRRAIPCSEGVNASGGSGVYEMLINVGTGIGLTGIEYEAQGAPDRFQIYWNNVLVADSKFVGDAITTSNPTGGIASGTFSMTKYEYDGNNFVNTGETVVVNIDNTVDVANNTTEPTNGGGTLLFNKTTAEPSVIRILVTGDPDSGTVWDVDGVCPIPEEEVIDGVEKVMYGFFTEANKADTFRSTGLVLGSSPVKFYTNFRGDVTFSVLGYSNTNQYINDGVNWWQINGQGEILSTGLL